MNTARRSTKGGRGGASSSTATSPKSSKSRTTTTNRKTIKVDYIRTRSRSRGRELSPPLSLPKGIQHSSPTATASRGKKAGGKKKTEEKTTKSKVAESSKAKTKTSKSVASAKSSRAITSGKSRSGAKQYGGISSPSSRSSSASSPGRPSVRSSKTSDATITSGRRGRATRATATAAAEVRTPIRARGAISNVRKRPLSAEYYSSDDETYWQTAERNNNEIPPQGALRGIWQTIRDMNIGSEIWKYIKLIVSTCVTIYLIITAYFLLFHANWGEIWRKISKNFASKQ